MSQEELLSRVAKVVGHELRNPLAVINNSVYFIKTKLASGGAVDPKVAKHLGILAEEVAKADALIGEILAFSRPLQLVSAPLDLNAVLEAALSELDAPPAVKVEKKLASGELKVRGDEARLREALGKLLDNAVQALPEGGAVTVATGRDKGRAWVEVRDAGPGLKPEAREHLFEPFFTTKPRGLGLGLAMARKIAEAHGGSLEGGDAPGGGTRFRLGFPSA